MKQRKTKACCDELPQLKTKSSRRRIRQVIISWEQVVQQYLIHDHYNPELELTVLNVLKSIEY